MTRLTILLSTAAVAVSGALAQNAQISGIVRDAQHAAIPNASVSAVDEMTGRHLDVHTNANGVYTLPTLQRGAYTLRIRAAGFQDTEIQHLNASVGARLLEDVVLTVGSNSETVEVNGSGPELNTTNADVSTVINRTFVENLPLNGRSFQSLITLAPGTSVVPSRGNGYSGEISVNGQRTEANYYIVDGVSANTGATPGTDGSIGAGFSGSTPQGTALGTTQALLSIDALEEFRSSTSSYSAQYGRTPGGQFSFSSRSGSNRWHGTAFDYLRNDALDAKNPFDTRKLTERQNDFGGTLGGFLSIPHLYNGRDKTFFFFSYEGLRLTNPVAATLYQVPSNSFRNGANTPISLKPFLNAFPTSSGADLGNGLANLTVGYAAPARLDTTSIRIDHNLTERYHLFGRYSDVPSSSTSRQPSDLAQVNSNGRNIKMAVFGLDSLFTSSLSNTLRAGVTGNDFKGAKYIDNFGGATPLNVSSAPGLGNGDWMTFFLFYGMYPYFLLQPQNNSQRQFNVVNSFSQRLHRHTLSYGVDYRYLRTGEILPPRWEVAFYFNQASVLTNKASGINMYTQNINMAARQNQFSAFVQDEWRVTDRMSLSAGVRWDVNPAPHDGRGNTPYTVTQITNLATTTAAPKGTALFQTRYNNFAPRVGVAYQVHREPGHETVFRAGGGLFYDTGLALSDNGYYGIGTTGFANYAGQAFPLTAQQVAATPAPSAAAPYNAPIFAYDPNLKLPYTGQWNAAVEQALGQQQSLTINYVASAGRRLTLQRFYRPESLGNTAFSQGKGLYITTGNAASDYNSLQVKFERRLAHGVQLLGSYTWSHGFDDASSNLTVYQQQRSVSDYDIRHSFQLAGTFELGGHYRNAAASYALTHWALDLRESARSALPIDVLDGGTVISGTSSTANFHPNLVANQPLYVYGSQYRGGRAINLAAFRAVAGVEGNTPRNYLRGFDAMQTDLTLRRDFPIHDQLGIQFRAEAYNLFNHAIYGSVYNQLSTNTVVNGYNTFGTAYNTLNNQLGGLSSLYQIGGPRSLQVALKLHF